MNKKTVVVLGLAQLTVLQLIAKARFIVQSMTGNAYFPTPTITLATISTDATDLQTAETNAEGGAKAAKELVKVKRQKMELDLFTLSAYVQTEANKKPDVAEAMVVSAGLESKKPAVHTTKVFSVSTTGNVGEVKLVTPTKKNAGYLWECSLTPDDENSWEIIGMTTRASLVKSGLESGKAYSFRQAYIDKDGQSPWSDVLSIIVS